MNITTWEQCTAYEKALDVSPMELAEAFNIITPWHKKVQEAMDKGQMRKLRNLMYDVPTRTKIAERVIKKLFDLEKNSDRKNEAKFKEIVNFYYLSEYYPKLRLEVLEELEKVGTILLEEFKTKKSIKPLRYLYYQVPKNTNLSRKIIQEMILRQK